MLQSHLLDAIRSIVGDKISLNDIVSGVLDISYDAAHRRTSGKSKLSFDEAFLLAQKYHLSLDELAGVASKNIVAVEKTQGISNEKGLEEYFRNSTTSLLGLSKLGGEILYSAKDIPIFYLLQGDILTRFKIYVWLKLLDDSLMNTSFTDFNPSLSLMQEAKKLGNVYANVPTTEIWDITTINSTLKQIHFYFEAGMLSNDDALLLCNTLHELVLKLLGKLKKSPSELKIYYNELLLMNNQVLVTTAHSTMLYVPFTMLSYFLCADRTTTKEAAIYFDKQMKHSKLLNDTSEKEQNRFANKMLKKVTALTNIIEAENLLDFQ